MSSEELYRSIGLRDRWRIAANDLAIDRLVMDPGCDRRMGISLILPAGLDEAAYDALVGELKASEPDQYYYPLGDLHTTVFDFLSCSDGYFHDGALAAAFLSIARARCAGADAPSILYRGVCCGREACMISGYDENALVALREGMRADLAAQGLVNSERYASRSAHCSFLRYAAPLRSAPAFLAACDAFGEREFGTVSFVSAVLVEHDWYNRVASVRVLEECDFRGMGKHGPDDWK